MRRPGSRKSSTGSRSGLIKPGIEQAEDVTEEVGDSMLPHPATVLGAVVAGPAGRGVLRVAGETGEVARLGRPASDWQRLAAQRVKAEGRVPSSHLPSAKTPHGNLVDDRPATRYQSSIRSATSSSTGDQARGSDEEVFQKADRRRQGGADRARPQAGNAQERT